MLPISMITEAQVDASADTKRRTAVVNQQQPQLQTTQPANPTIPIPTKPGFVAHMKNKLEKSGMNLGGGSKPNITAQQQISSDLGNQFKDVTGKMGDQMNNAQGKTVLTQLKDSQQQQKKVVGFEGSGLTLNDWKKIKNESIQHIKQLINSDTRFKNSTLETSKEKELGLKSNKEQVTQVYNENSQSVITRMTNPPSDATLIASFKMNQMLNEISMEKLDGKLTSPELFRIYQAAVLTGCEKSFKMGPQDRAKLESNNYYNQLKSSGIDLNAYVIAYEQQNKKPYPLGEPLDSKIVNALQQSQPISQPPKNKP